LICGRSDRQTGSYLARRYLRSRAMVRMCIKVRCRGPGPRVSPTRHGRQHHAPECEYRRGSIRSPAEMPTGSVQSTPVMADDFRARTRSPQDSRAFNASGRPAHCAHSRQGHGTNPPRSGHRRPMRGGATIKTVRRDVTRRLRAPNRGLLVPPRRQFTPADASAAVPVKHSRRRNVAELCKAAVPPRVRRYLSFASSQNWPAAKSAKVSRLQGHIKPGSSSQGHAPK
jgi:hypothetical protein